jgi:hypothetical protein
MSSRIQDTRAMAALLMALVACSVCLSAGAAKPSAVPAWLDTVPPVVKVLPKDRVQGQTFFIAFETSEHAVVRCALGSPLAMQTYASPLPVIEDGKVVVYFSAEDDFGNKSRLDSATFVLDTRPPEISVDPRPGRYRRAVKVHLHASERCTFYFVGGPDSALARQAPDSFTVSKSFEGYIAAKDGVGNKAVTEKLSYIIDTTSVVVKCSPDGGLFNTPRPIVISSDPATCDVFYSFDALAPASWFKPYAGPVPLPVGTSLMRYFARTKEGAESPIMTSRFVVDTVPPRVKVDYEEGRDMDRIILSTREPARIYYALGEKPATEESPLYRAPLQIPHKARAIVTAFAKDSAGNVSDYVRWEKKYDIVPPTVALSTTGGTYNRALEIKATPNEPAWVFYTVDGSAPTRSSTLYTGPVLVSREGRTVFRCLAVDEAGNESTERGASFVIDTKSPNVRVRVEADVTNDRYTVSLNCDEAAQIYYEIGDKTPTRAASPQYRDKLVMKSGQKLRYFAVDAAGNTTEVRSMDELQNPMVSANPPAGSYRHRLKIGFAINVESTVLWRILPDTALRPYRDSIKIDKEGTTTLEYFSRSSAGIESPLTRSVYFVDWSAPQVEVVVRKGFGDSITVFFEATENASIFYTADGTSPLFNPMARVAGNKLTKSKDRISLSRSTASKLAFFAEDAIGNQSGLTVMDLAKPRAVPSVPPSRERVYRKFLSVALSAVDDRSQVYYARHGHLPTLDSAVCTEPITLVRSDTICAFVVDAAGFIGEVDTFVYLIDLPPSPRFLVSPDTLYEGVPVRFDASVSVDQETPLAALKFRWDFDGDSIFDTDFSSTPHNMFTYKTNGFYAPVLEVKDGRDRIASYSRDVRVQKVCPAGMVFATDAHRHGFCIDKYEWPNQARTQPTAVISWVEARMACVNAGKRLCTAQEWTSACQGTSPAGYPYGSTYDKERCPTEGKQIYRSGSFKTCQESFGLSDMVGNVWEWIEDKKDGYPMMMGGSYQSGNGAHCRRQSAGTVGTLSKDVGFRCCW